MEHSKHFISQSRESIISELRYFKIPKQRKNQHAEAYDILKFQTEIEKSVIV